jgi:hypothetical protein
VEKEAVFTEHLPLCKTELFHELPVIVVGHKNNAPEFSNPLGPLGPIMGKTKRISRSVFAINETLPLVADLKMTPSFLALPEVALTQGVRYLVIRLKPPPRFLPLELAATSD